MATETTEDTTNTALTKTVQIGENVYNFPTKTSELENDAGFITEGGSGVTVINLDTATTAEKRALYNDLQDDPTNASKYRVFGKLSSSSERIVEWAFQYVIGSDYCYFTAPSFNGKYTYTLSINYASCTLSYGTTVNVYNNTITIKQGTTSKGSFTLNQSSEKTITLDAVPTKTSELTNDSGFITIDSVPTKTSELTNDSGFITEGLAEYDIENADDMKTVVANIKADNYNFRIYKTFTENDSETVRIYAHSVSTKELMSHNGLMAFFLKENITEQAFADHLVLINPDDGTVNQTMDFDFVQKGDLATVATSGSYNDLEDTPTVPTKTSDLTNDSNFMTTSQTSESLVFTMSDGTTKTVKVYVVDE